MFYKHFGNITLFSQRITRVFNVFTTDNHGDKFTYLSKRCSKSKQTSEKIAIQKRHFCCLNYLVSVQLLMFRTYIVTTDSRVSTYNSPPPTGKQKYLTAYELMSDVSEILRQK